MGLDLWPRGLTDDFYKCTPVSPLCYMYSLWFHIIISPFCSQIIDFGLENYSRRTALGSKKVRTAVELIELIENFSNETSKRLFLLNKR